MSAGQVFYKYYHCLNCNEKETIIRFVAFCEYEKCNTTTIIFINYACNLNVVASEIYSIQNLFRRMKM